MREDRFIGQDTVVGKYHAPDANYEMNVRDYVLRPSADGDSGPIVITLPGVSESRGRSYSILTRAADAINTVTIADKDDSESWGGDYIFVAAGNSVIMHSDGMKWTAMFGGFGVLSVKTTITAAQVKALGAAPIVIVPVLGATKVIEFLSATLHLEYGSEVFAEVADNLAIRYTNGAGIIVSDTIEMTGFIDQAADTMTRAVPIKDAIVAAAGAIGQQLVLDNINDEFTGNASDDSVLTIWTLFRMIETG